MQITATATRSGEWWAVEVPEIPGLFTQARRLDQVEAEVIDAATLLGVEVDEVEVQPVLSPSERELVARLQEAREAARNAEEVASAASRAAVRAFRDEGLTVRDVAAVIGISPQRVSQLA